MHLQLAHSKLIQALPESRRNTSKGGLGATITVSPLQCTICIHCIQCNYCINCIRSARFALYHGVIALVMQAALLIVHYI